MASSELLAHHVDRVSPLHSGTASRVLGLSRTPSVAGIAFGLVCLSLRNTRRHNVCTMDLRSFAGPAPTGRSQRGCAVCEKSKGPESGSRITAAVSTSSANVCALQVG